MRIQMMHRSSLLVAAFALAACGSSDNDTGADAAAETADAMASDVAVSPSFDCAKADGEATKLVCADTDLAAMDRELDRLYGLALNGQYMTPERKIELEATQRGWIKGRDDCWKADDKRQCVMAEYAMRIHEIRQGYADARTKDEDGLSSGPVALACDGLDFGISATFVQTDPGAVYLQWKNSGIALAHVPSGSGAKYEGMWDGKLAALFTQGDEAIVTLPGEPERKCRIEEIG